MRIYIILTMSCACLNKKFAEDRERIRRLAKALAVIEGKHVAIYRNADQTYGFTTADTIGDKSTIELITPYQ